MAGKKKTSGAIKFYEAATCVVGRKASRDLNGGNNQQKEQERELARLQAEKARLEASNAARSAEVETATAAKLANAAAELKRNKHEADARAVAGSKKKPQTAIVCGKPIALGRSNQIAKAQVAWQKKVDRLQEAMEKLKRSRADNDVKLSQLPITRKQTGRETHNEKLKLLKTSIKDAQWEVMHGAALTANNIATAQEEKILAKEKQGSRADKSDRTDNTSMNEPAKRAQRPAAFSDHHSRAQPTDQGQWSLVDSKNSFAATTAAERCKRVAELKVATAKREGKQKKEDNRRGTKQMKEEATGRQSGPGQTFWDSMRSRWADNVQECATESQQESGVQAAVKKSAKEKHAKFCAPPAETDVVSAAIPHHHQVEATQKSYTRNQRQEHIRIISSFFPANATSAHFTFVGLNAYPQASFLGLPEKIREQICRLVVVQKDTVRVTRSSYKQPALLRTCQQLRMETLCVFEVENTFSIEVIDYKPVVPASFTTHWIAQVMFEMEISGTPKWDKLKEWLRACHEEGVPGLSNREAGISAAWDICGQAFEMILRLRAIKPKIMFEEMAPMLEVWKKTVAMQQVGWTWE